uniref:Uncharacterized protein n=1 Tax=Arundo donax TaxID=35708 RepID=A0A0A8Z0W2_ARUDO
MCWRLSGKGSGRVKLVGFVRRKYSFFSESGCVQVRNLEHQFSLHCHPNYRC